MFPYLLADEHEEYLNTTDLQKSSFGNIEYSSTTVCNNNLLGIEKREVPSFSIYPNPATKTLIINDGIQAYNYSILSITGDLILKECGSKVDLANLNTGFYFIVIENDKGKFTTQKFMEN